MCGLLAASGKINPDFIRALGCLNSKRGKDSAGVGWVVGEELWTAKIASNPITAYTVHLAKDIDIAAATGTIIGHTRAATMGAVNDDNAHPFVYDGIIFAHNGIIHNHADFGTYKVDSEALIHGIKKKDFSDYRGPIALIWIEGGKLHAFRHGNPLFRGLKDGALYLASEEDMLKQIGCENTRELAEGHCYTIAGGGIVKSVPVKKNTIYGGTTYSSSSSSNPHWSQAAKPQPKPSKRAACICGHKGRDHNQAHYTTGNWACYAKTGLTETLCSCNGFTSKRKEEREERRRKQMSTQEWRRICTCKHTVKIHVASGGNMTCRAPDCPCVMFKLSESNETPRLPIILGTPPPDAHSIPTRNIAGFNTNPYRYQMLDNFEHMPDNTPCECEHEKEYHSGAQRLHCMVANCTCSMFWPKDDQLVLGM